MSAPPPLAIRFRPLLVTVAADLTAITAGRDVAAPTLAL
jgi:hypothetical protein